MSSTVHIAPQLVAAVEVGVAVGLVGLAVLGASRFVRKKSTAPVRSASGTAPASRAVAVSDSQTIAREAELATELSRASTLEAIRDVHTRALPGSKVEIHAAQKHDQMLATILKTVSTIEECEEIRIQALERNGIVAETFRARVRDITRGLLASVTSFDTCLKLYQNASVDEDEQLGALFLEKLFSLARSQEEYRAVYDASPKESEQETLAAERHDQRLTQELATATTLDECERIADLAIGDDLGIAANERRIELLRLELASCTTGQQAIDLYNRLPEFDADDDDPFATLASDILSKGALLASSIEECLAVYEAMPGDEEDAKVEGATALLEKALGICTTTTECVKLYEEASGLTQETTDKILRRGLELAASYDDCDEVDAQVDEYSDITADEVLAVKVGFMESVDECIEVITDDEADQDVQRSAILRAADLIRKEAVEVTEAPEGKLATA